MIPPKTLDDVVHADVAEFDRTVLSEGVVWLFHAVRLLAIYCLRKGRV